MVDICHYVSLAYISTSSIHDKADGIKENAKSGTNVLV